MSLRVKVFSRFQIEVGCEQRHDSGYKAGEEDADNDSQRLEQGFHRAPADGREAVMDFMEENAGKPKNSVKPEGGRAVTLFIDTGWSLECNFGRVAGLAS